MSRSRSREDYRCAGSGIDDAGAAAAAAGEFEGARVALDLA